MEFFSTFKRLPRALFITGVCDIGCRVGLFRVELVPAAPKKQRRVVPHHLDHVFSVVKVHIMVQRPCRTVNIRRATSPAFRKCVSVG